MQQFFIDSWQNPTLNKEQIRQCKTVLRMRQGDEIRIVDKKGQGYYARFTTDDCDKFEIGEAITFVQKEIEITLLMSLIRAEALELTIQKATELGVDRIVFYQAEHGVVRDYGKKTQRKLERFALIAKEAAEQSHQQTIPEIGPIIDQRQIDSYLSDLNLLADVHQDDYVHKMIKDKQTVTVLIGPEGGFSDEERTYFTTKGFKGFSLSPFILRAETAAMTALAQIQLAKEMSHD